MVAILAPVTATKQHVPVVQQARFTVDRGMVKRQYNRVRLNDMPTLWPFGYLRDEAFRFAKQFVSDMEAKGKELLSAEADIVLLGPYRHRKFSDDLVSGGRQTGEDHYQDQADFVLEAGFLASRVHRVEMVVRSDAGA